jgi:hypothetical protein
MVINDRLIDTAMSVWEYQRKRLRRVFSMLKSLREKLKFRGFCIFWQKMKKQSKSQRQMAIGFTWIENLSDSMENLRHRMNRVIISNSHFQNSRRDRDNRERHQPRNLMLLSRNPWDTISIAYLAVDNWDINRWPCRFGFPQSSHKTSIFAERNRVHFDCRSSHLEVIIDHLVTMVFFCWILVDHRCYDSWLEISIKPIMKVDRPMDPNRPSRSALTLLSLCSRCIHIIIPSLFSLLSFRFWMFSISFTSLSPESANFPKCSGFCWPSMQAEVKC